MEGEYNVVYFFEDGSYEYEHRRVSAERAVKAAYFATESVAARMGWLKRVIITDSGDATNFEWTSDRGIVFPRPEQITH